MMMPINILIICVIIGVLISLAVISSKKGLKSCVNRFSDRSSIDLEELRNDYFPDSSLVNLKEGLTAISKVTGIALGRLRPNDRFDGELKMPDGYFLAGEWDDLDEHIAELRTKSGSSKTIQTVGDYIELINASGQTV